MSGENIELRILPAKERRQTAAPQVNNAFYDELGDRWYDDDQHAVALLRVEAAIKGAFTRDVLKAHGIGPGARILDVGCGAGFVTIPLAAAGYQMKGIDLAAGALATADQRAAALGAQRPVFEAQNALALKEDSGRYDAVLLLDFLEHVDQPGLALQEAARVLRPNGVAVLHTFNRTLAARLLAIQALKLFTKDCPPHLHVYELFLKPTELADLARAAGLEPGGFRGLRPALGLPFWKSLLRRRLAPGFSFRYSRSLAVGYIGHAVKRPAGAPSR